MADLAVITGASSGLGVKFLESVIHRYPQLDEYWIIARRKERLEKLAEAYKDKKIITCSVSSFAPVPCQTVYSATKKYIYYFGRALREELLEKEINVLLLCPGNMDTEMNPKGQQRQGRKINRLPFLDMDILTAKALEKAEKGKGVYTPGTFYKFYRVVSRIFPSLWLMKTAKKFY